MVYDNPYRIYSNNFRKYCHTLGIKPREFCIRGEGMLDEEDEWLQEYCDQNNFYYQEFPLKAGLGPAVYLTNAEYNDFGHDPLSYDSAEEALQNYDKTKPGIIAELSVQAPRRSRLFVELKFQYHIVGKMEMGPFEIKTKNNVTPFPVFPKTKLST